MQPMIVCALQAPGSDALFPKRQRRTFWAACSNCKQKKKYPIENKSCSIICKHCNNPFAAFETTRPRNNQASTSANVAPPPKMVPPAAKKIKLDGNIAHGMNWTTKLLKQCDIKLLLKEKGKSIVENMLKEIKQQKGSDNN